MAIVLQILALISVVAGIAAYGFVVVYALRAPGPHGFRCVIMPCYTLYYLFAIFDHPKKELIAAIFVAGGVVGTLLLQLATILGAASLPP